MSLKPEQMFELVESDRPDLAGKWLFQNDFPQTGSSETEIQMQKEDECSYLQRRRVLHICRSLVMPYKLEVYNFTTCWQDGRALCAIAHRFQPDALDFSSIKAEHRADNRRRAISILEKLFGLTPPTDCDDWLDGTKNDPRLTFEYLSVLVRLISEHVAQKMLALRSRSAALVPKKQPEVDKRSLAAAPADTRELMKEIRRRNMPVASKVGDSDNIEELLEHLEELDEDQIATILEEWEDEDTRQTLRARKQRTEKLERMIGVKLQPDANYTKKPGLICKLDPDRVNKVEAMVSGEMEKRKVKTEYNRKFKEAEIRTRKLEQHEIAEMEEKLEQTALGSLLCDKEKLRAMSTQDEQIVRARAAQSRQIVLSGFEQPLNENLKEFDQKLSEMSEKESEIVPSMPVSQLIAEHSQRVLLSAGPKKKPPPPPPAKLNATHSPSSADTSQNGSVNDVNSDVGGFSGAFGGSRVSLPRLPNIQPSTPLCYICSGRVYLAEKLNVDNRVVHKKCFRCGYCASPLRLNYCVLETAFRANYGNLYYCTAHSALPRSEKLRALEVAMQRGGVAPAAAARAKRTASNCGSDQGGSAMGSRRQSSNLVCSETEKTQSPQHSDSIQPENGHVARTEPAQCGSAKRPPEGKASSSGASAQSGGLLSRLFASTLQDRRDKKMAALGNAKPSPTAISPTTASDTSAHNNSSDDTDELAYWRARHERVCRRLAQMETSAGHTDSQVVHNLAQERRACELRMQVAQQHSEHAQTDLAFRSGNNDGSDGGHTKVYFAVDTMRYVAAYLLSTMGGNSAPGVADLERIMASVGVDCDKKRAQMVVDALKGKNLDQLVEIGKTKLASVSGDMAVGAMPMATADGGAVPAAAAGPAETKVEEKKAPSPEPSDSDEDMGLGLFDD